VDAHIVRRIRVGLARRPRLHHRDLADQRRNTPLVFAQSGALNANEEEKQKETDVERKIHTSADSEAVRQDLRGRR
jgi:hypothetical protein